MTWPRPDPNPDPTYPSAHSLQADKNKKNKKNVRRENLNFEKVRTQRKKVRNGSFLTAIFFKTGGVIVM
jgi:hypothetical protein